MFFRLIIHHNNRNKSRNFFSCGIKQIKKKYIDAAGNSDEGGEIYIRQSCEFLARERELEKFVLNREVNLQLSVSVTLVHVQISLGHPNKLFRFQHRPTDPPFFQSTI